MKRSNDDKRVLRSGNGRQSNSRNQKRNNRQVFSRNQRKNRYPRTYQNSVNPRTRRNRKKRSNKLVFLMILALVAFVIGAGIGVSLSLDDGSDEGPKYENVTKDMTTNLNDTEEVYFDKTTDDVDYNENETSQLDIQYQYIEN